MDTIKIYITESVDTVVINATAAVDTVVINVSEALQGEKGDPGSNFALSAGINYVSTGTAILSNANGITFGMDTAGVVTASHNGITAQTGNFASTDHVHTIYPVNSLFAGTNISGTINSTAFNLSVAAAPTILAAHAGTAFSGTNISGTVNSTALQLNVAASGNSTSFGYQSATPTQITGASSVLANNGGWVTVVTAQTGNFLSTNADTAYAKNSLFAGTNISGTLNSTAFQLSVAASGNSTSFASQAATPTQTTGYSSILGNNGVWNAINSIASTNHSHNIVVQGGMLVTNSSSVFTLSAPASTNHPVNSFFSGTNISGTLNSTAFALSVAAPPTILAAHAGTAFSGTNISGTINSTALQLSVAAPGGGGAAMALSASTSNVATGGTIFITGNNITISMTTSTNGSHTMSLSGNAAGAGANLSNYVWPSDVFHGNIVTTLSTPISTNVTLRAMKVPSAIQFSKIEWPVSIAVASTNNNTASTQQLRHTVVIYSKNGASLNPIVGVAATNSYTVSSASTGSVVGPRWISAPLATTLTPGDYWVGIQAQTAGQQAMTLNHILVSAGSQMAAFLRDGQSITTAAFESTGPFAGFPLQGIIVASLSNTTNTWNISQISVAPASYYRANMIFQFKDITY